MKSEFPIPSISAFFDFNSSKVILVPNKSLHDKAIGYLGNAMFGAEISLDFDSFVSLGKSKVESMLSDFGNVDHSIVKNETHKHLLKKYNEVLVSRQLAYDQIWVDFDDSGDSLKLSLSLTSEKFGEAILSYVKRKVGP